MSFRFKKKESVARAVRRLCRERLDDALETLEKGRRLDAVHHVRKDIKKMRSVLRLMRREISEHSYAEHAKVLREAASLLTEFRDAQVKLNAFDALIKHSRRKHSLPSFSKIHAALRESCREEEKKLGRLTTSLKGILNESRHEFKKLEIEAKGWGAIEPGLKKVYGRGREAFEVARDQLSPVNFHAWRKRVKDLGHQLRLLCPARPRRLNKLIERLARLSDLLGDDHDLFMLNQFVAAHSVKAPDAATLQELIELRQQELRIEALKWGAQFYWEKPGRFCRKIGSYWKSWRK
jgi:CHAD domain-containing protein